MPHKAHSALSARARILENEFFAKRDQAKIAALRAEIEARAKRHGLAEVSGIPDESVMNQLLEVGVTAQTLAALSLVPLVLVAWADGKLDDKERKAVLEAAASRGLEPGHPAHELLSTWLCAAPEPALRTTWHDYVAAFRDHLPAETVQTLRAWVLDRATDVATATGGILGLGKKISSEEQAVLDDLASAFDPS